MAPSEQTYLRSDWNNARAPSRGFAFARADASLSELLRLWTPR